MHARIFDIVSFYLCKWKGENMTNQIRIWTQILWTSRQVLYQLSNLVIGIQQRQFQVPYFRDCIWAWISLRLCLQTLTSLVKSLFDRRESGVFGWNVVCMLDDCISMVLLCNRSPTARTSVGSSGITPQTHLCDLLILNSTLY